MKINYFDKFHKLNRIRFFLLFAFVLAFFVFSFLAAWAKDEGTLGSNFLANFAADAFAIMRFPFLMCLDWLLSDTESILISWIGFLFFFPSIILTVVFYCLMIEGLTMFLRFLLK